MTFAIGGRFAQKVGERLMNDMRRAVVPFGPIGLVTYKRTYSRRLFDDGVPTSSCILPGTNINAKEDYWQTMVRCLNGILDIGGVFTHKELEVLAGYLMQLKCNFSGRALWQLGTKTVAKLGGDSLQACWHVRVDEPIHPFMFTFDELMLGGGVGFSIMPEDVYSIPPIKFKPIATRVNTWDCDFIVPDNREGWVELYRKVFDQAYITGKPFTYNTNCVRGKGAPIKSFGGVASGPEELVQGLNFIIEILSKRVGEKLRPVDALDIQNIIGMVVVAGNVRRSAQIAKGSGRDRDFLLAKYWGDGAIIPRWRGQSNNTVAESNLDNLLPEFWWGYENMDENGDAKGECYGLYNPDLAADYGRIVDGPRPGYNSRVCGPNPCGEIMLESNEACNLAELYLTNLKDSIEFHTAAELMYKCIKTISCLPFQNPRTQEVVSRNHRLGLGVTGVMAAHHLRKAEYFDSVYKHVVKTDKEYSKTLATTESIAYTTVKPSGTAAKLPIGCPPGANGGYSQFTKLLITFAADSPMLPTLKELGYPMEPKINLDGSKDFSTMMVGFPVAYPDGVPTDDNLTAIEQLENIKFLQTWWSDNAVSSTVQFRPHEVPEIKDWLSKNYTHNIKTVAFCRHTGHGFVQPPNTPLTREEYDAFVSTVRPITRFIDDGDDSAIDGIECGPGGCPVK